MPDESKPGKARRKQQEPGPQRNEPAPEPEEVQPAVIPTSPEGDGSAAGTLCPVIGIGASAGGLGAIQRFFGGMSKQIGDTLAVVVVQHLDPEHKSMLAELIGHYAQVPVREAADGAPVEPGYVYVVPPNRDISLEHGKLHVVEPSRPHGLRQPIDFFFRSMATQCRDRAVGVILSGTGTDGTLGLKAIKEADGLVVVQQPETAQYDGMPRSAIGTGLADYVLPPQEMPGRIADYVQRWVTGAPAHNDAEHEAPDRSEPLRKLFALLRSHTGHDFSRYKRNTIIRRIDRRIVVHQLESLKAYVDYLRDHPVEITILFRELLIGVTNFFRDPEVWSAVEETVIPAVFADKQPGDTVRVWVPGCSTGEEAFTIAMLLHEHIARSQRGLAAQIFATDIDADALDQARAAVYPDSIAADISPERLERFFVSEGNAFRLKKIVRDMVVFAAQNVAEDPPFSRVDLVSCRNLLIYMNTDLQRRVVPLFHYALNPAGYLLLGTSESVGEFTDLFTTVDRQRKLFKRKPNGRPPRAPVDFSQVVRSPEAEARRPVKDSRTARTDVRHVLEQVLLTQHAPAAVVVSAEGEVVYVHGRAGYYLEPAQGDATLNVVKMAREGLRLELSAALRKAISGQESVVQRDVTVKANGSSRTVNLMVRPMPEAARPGLYLVLFEEVPRDERAEKAAREPRTGDKDQRIDSLERELRAKEEYLQATIEELETSNEELTSTNEELQSANEELQSTNEELETSKEELQSVNEELMTVNVELQKKIEELSRLNNDLNNLLAGTGIGTVFVDRLLRIQRFTPAATEIINLIQTDVGRPVAHMASNFVGYPDLVRDIAAVQDTLIPKEREVQVVNGNWYLMRLQPYRTLENVIEGTVLTFVNITEQKRVQAALEEMRRLRVESVFDPVLVVNAGGRIMDANQDLLEFLGYRADELRDMRLAELVEGESYAALRSALDAAGRGESPQLEFTLRCHDGSTVTAGARMRRVVWSDSGAIFIVLRRKDAQEGETEQG